VQPGIDPGTPLWLSPVFFGAVIAGIPVDLLLLHRWRCWLGAYNVKTVPIEEHAASKMRRGVSKLLLLKRAGLFKSEKLKTDVDTAVDEIQADGKANETSAAAKLHSARTLHVRSIAADVPVTSLVSDDSEHSFEQYGEYENEDSLKKCFLPFGSVVTVTVRHRIQKVESGELKNTSWALVTMARHSETKKILEAAASGKVKAGINELHIELLNEDKAIRSSGQMAQIWTKHKLLVGSSSGRSRKYLAQRPSRSSSLVRALPDFVLLAGKVRNISAPRFRSGSQSVLAVMSCPSWPAHPRHFTSQNLLPGGPRTPRIASTSHLPSHLQSPRGRPCGACSRCCCCLLAALSLELYSASILPEYSSADIALQGDPYTPSTHTSLESPCNGGIDGYFTSEHGLSQ
jgi:hypothetical protein